jgi:hypothetical protein
MHMVAIGWLWVAFMMAISEKSAVAGVMTFVFYGLVPCAVLLYILNKHAGKRRQHLADKRAREAQVQAGEAVDAPEAEVPDEKNHAAREP